MYQVAVRRKGDKAKSGLSLVRNRMGISAAADADVGLTMASVMISAPLTCHVIPSLRPQAIPKRDQCQLVRSIVIENRSFTSK